MAGPADDPTRLSTELGWADTILRWLALRVAEQDTKLLVADPIALRYLEPVVYGARTTTPTSTVTIRGYQAFLVNEWVCPRDRLAAVFYTQAHSPSEELEVAEITLPAGRLSEVVRAYATEMDKMQAEPAILPAGVLFVTDFNRIPTGLNCIRLASDNVDVQINRFVVNVNLRRLECSGKALPSANPPTDSMRREFAQYGADSSWGFDSAVIELVRMVQQLLFLSGYLDDSSVDGFFCDITEKALQAWWDDIGLSKFNTEDTATMGVKIAGLYGVLAGSHQRLDQLGFSVGKTVFDTTSTIKGLEEFQRAEKIVPTTGRLDSNTFWTLNKAGSPHEREKATQKAAKLGASGFGGKGVEMMKGLVGRSKTAVELETISYDRFVENIATDPVGWIWASQKRDSPVTVIPIPSKALHPLISPDRLIAIVSLATESAILGPDSDDSDSSVDRPSYLVRAGKRVKAVVKGHLPRLSTDSHDMGSSGSGESYVPGAVESARASHIGAAGVPGLGPLLEHSEPTSPAVRPFLEPARRSELMLRPIPTQTSAVTAGSTRMSESGTDLEQLLHDWMSENVGPEPVELSKVASRRDIRVPVPASVAVSTDGTFGATPDGYGMCADLDDSDSGLDRPSYLVRARKRVKAAVKGHLPRLASDTDSGTQTPVEGGVSAPVEKLKLAARPGAPNLGPLQEQLEPISPRSNLTAPAGLRPESGLRTVIGASFGVSGVRTSVSDRPRPPVTPNGEWEDGEMAILTTIPSLLVDAKMTGFGQTLRRSHSTNALDELGSIASWNKIAAKLNRTGAGSDPAQEQAILGEWEKADWFDARLPRSASFSVVEEAVLPFVRLAGVRAGDDDDPNGISQFGRDGQDVERRDGEPATGVDVEAHGEQTRIPGTDPRFRLANRSTPPLSGKQRRFGPGPNRLLNKLQFGYPTSASAGVSAASTPVQVAAGSMSGPATTSGAHFPAQHAVLFPHTRTGLRVAPPVLEPGGARTHQLAPTVGGGVVGLINPAAATTAVPDANQGEVDEMTIQQAMDREQADRLILGLCRKRALDRWLEGDIQARRMLVQLDRLDGQLRLLDELVANRIRARYPSQSAALAGTTIPSSQQATAAPNTPVGQTAGTSVGGAGSGPGGTGSQTSGFYHSSVPFAAARQPVSGAQLLELQIKSLFGPDYFSHQTNETSVRVKKLQYDLAACSQRVTELESVNEKSLDPDINRLESRFRRFYGSGGLTSLTGLTSPTIGHSGRDGNGDLDDGVGNGGFESGSQSATTLVIENMMESMTIQNATDLAKHPDRWWPTMVKASENAEWTRWWGMEEMVAEREDGSDDRTSKCWTDGC